MAIFQGLWGKITGNDSGDVDRLKKRADEVLALEETMRALQNSELPVKLAEYRKRHTEGASLDQLLPEVFALVRETARRVLGEHPYPVQIMGAVALHEGSIAEMKTGEGKTLVSTMPITLNAVAGKGVHVVTVNEYLATRDAEWMSGIYTALGLSVGAIAQGQSPEEKREQYAADITYGTNNEFGFDYLRDNMAYSLSDKVQRDLHYAIVDEVDSILIDEARTPLIISAPDEESSKQYAQFTRIAPRLEKGTDYEVDEKQRAVTLTDEGITKVENILGVKNLYADGEVRVIHYLEQTLRAHALYQRDVDYVVKDGEVIIVDQFTGRLMPGRRYSEGLHQAIEAKERVDVKQESRTLATVTFQNFFRLYKKLSGMTGTAKTSEEEFQRVYDLVVHVIPTNKSMVRKDLPDSIYSTELGKFKNVVQEIKHRHKEGQPVLVGTIAIEKSELLSRMLEREGVPHEVLNAKNHAREADIIANAGQKHAVTISTNMAGRGTDIKLGEGVAALGGLHVLGTERHEARRIDNQLRGRSGRQGDPGSSQFFISAEDDVMRIFGGDRIKGILQRLNVPEDEPIESRMLSRAVEGAQSRVEGYYFDARKHVLQFDDVMNRQRDAFYNLRTSILQTEEKPETMKEVSVAILTEALEEAVMGALSMESENDDYKKRVRDTIEQFINISEGEWSPIEQALQEEVSDEIPEETRNALRRFSESYYDRLEKQAPDTAIFARTIRALFLRSLDQLWIEHLETMEYLRTGIGLRGYGQRDPLVEYRNEGRQLFNALMANFRSEAARAFFHLQLHTELPVAQPRQRSVADLILSRPDVVKPIQKQAQVSKDTSKGKKVGRNDPCPCGSGKKYKKCHGK